MDWQPFLLTLQVALFATVVILVAGIALALFLARTHIRGKLIIETLITLPLVLPPSVVGYYLLIVLGRNGPLVRWFDLNVLFTWPAAVIASSIVGLPLMIQAARAAIENVDPAMENAARTLGSSEAEVIWRVTLPLARRGIWAGLILGAARALGEFGATLMVAGDIPGRTQTAPLAIYDAVQAGRFADANWLVGMLTLLSLASLSAVGRLQRRSHEIRSHA
ncbi:MAG: molybdate ABC transporter permease subunit [Chloroflexi bacterium]|nr:molybdate ABC transporter permease subunit [Chloroflexota bacterium]